MRTVCIICVMIGFCSFVKAQRTVTTNGTWKTYTKVYDKKVPQDKLCTFITGEGMNVKRFDGKRVAWGGYYAQNTKAIQYLIPEGKHTLEVYYEYVDYAGRTEVGKKSEIIEYIFEAGKTYVLRMSKDYNTKTVTFGIKEDDD